MRLENLSTKKVLFNFVQHFNKSSLCLRPKKVLPKLNLRLNHFKMHPFSAGVFWDMNTTTYKNIGNKNETGLFQYFVPNLKDI